MVSILLFEYILLLPLNGKTLSGAAKLIYRGAPLPPLSLMTQKRTESRAQAQLKALSPFHVTTALQSSLTLRLGGRHTKGDRVRRPPRGRLAW